MSQDLLQEYRSTLRTKIFRKMAAAGLDSFLVTDLPTIRWLTGFSGSHAKLLFAKESATVLFTDFRYEEQVRQETSGIATVILKDPFPVELASGSFRLGERMALQADHITWHETQQLSEKLRRLEFSPVSAFFDEFREINHIEEVDRMRRAVALSESVLEEVIGMIGPGVTEIDLAAEITYRHRKLGAEGDSFDPIVAGGIRGAMPHAKPTTSEFEPGSLIVIDMGCIVEGYASDQTRTVAFGRISEEQREVYRIVQEAQQLGIDAAKAGMAARDLDAEVRNFIAAAGYGEAFGHGLGHGVGVEVHEAPRVGTASTGILREGTLFTIEPGIYLPGRFGVRIEDMVALGPNGAEPLQRFTKELIEL